jgi:hypothetical protein
MPWHIEEQGDEFCVIKDDDGANEGCHPTREEAMEQLEALYATEPDATIALLEEGPAFHMLFFVEGLETDGDGRYFELGTWIAREGRRPLMLQDRAEHGGIGGDTTAWFAGSFDAERDPREPTRWLGHGNLMPGERGEEAEAMIRAGLTGVSVDASATAGMYFDVRKVDEAGNPVDMLCRFLGGTILGATITPHQALGPCVIWMADTPEPEHVALTAGHDLPHTEDPEVVDDGLPLEALLAAGAPAKPPAAWFANPRFGLNPEVDPRLGDCPDGGYGCHLTVTDHGQIYGHLATWQQAHMSFAGIFAPRCISDPPYEWFMRGEVVTDDGSRVRAGKLTLGTGHADDDERVSIHQAIAHYDNTGTVVADIAVGEDAHGIWCAGAMRPGVSEADTRALIAADISGDWRPVNRARELCAVLCVNFPGFPVPRPRAREYGDGELGALVAAAGPAWMPRTSRPALRRAAAKAGAKVIILTGD